KLLNLTVSAVSKSVARLEERLGTRLFERTTRSLTLTDAGLALYEVYVRILRELDEAESVLDSQETSPVGRLRMDVPIAYGHKVVLPVLLEFADRHPHLQFRVSFTDRFTDIIEEGIDLAVRIGSSDLWPASLGHRLIGRERKVFCSSPAYLQRRGMPQTDEDLGNYDCILYGKADGSTLEWSFPHGDGRIEKRPMPARMVLGSAEAQVSAVLAGYGITQLPTWLIKDELASGELVEILPHLSTSGLLLNLVWPQSRRLTPKMNALVEGLSGALLID
ncbi:MAG: LysR family transcriptional regulator, partial [Proteobacteria bacterium]